MKITLSERATALKAPRRVGRSRVQEGFALIEVLVAILVFSIGVLGIIGLQAMSIKKVSEAKYRIDAANLADQLIGQMWAEDHLSSALAARYVGASATGYTAWKAVVDDRLPGASSHPPSVTVEADASDASKSTVTLVVYWQPPGSADINNYTTVSRIR